MQTELFLPSQDLGRTSSLKGKWVLTTNFYGRILNEAEKEQAIILQSVRKRVLVDRSSDPIRRMYGAPLRWDYWLLDDTQQVVPWEEAREMKVCEEMPEFLAERHLGERHEPIFLTTVIDGRSYIDW